MRKVLVIVSIVVVVVLVVIVVLVAGIIPWSSSGPVPTSTASPSSSTSSTSTPVTGTTPSNKADVKFEFGVTNITGSGLSRTITAQVSNVGTGDAHNVWGKVEAASQGSKVKLNGQDSVRVNIGNIPAGTTTTAQVSLSFSITDGIRIAQNGVTMTLTIYSDEYTDTFTYDYKP